MIRSQNALNFAYVVYLKLREQKAKDIERYVARWFVLSVLTGRYSASPESAFDFDIRQIASKSFSDFLKEQEQANLSDGFWNFGLVQELSRSATTNPVFNVYLAAQVKSKDRGFLSRDITVADLITYRGDIHHIFPKSFLKQKGHLRGSYNQIGNYVYMQQEINIKIGAKGPDVYFNEVKEQCNGGRKLYGSIDGEKELKENLAAHCIPQSVFDASIERYEDFLIERRSLMAAKIKEYYNGL
jgi:hypothetical protein